MDARAEDPQGTVPHMAMTTRCPHCGTAFKVVADQLRVRNGLVRCGVCSRVFDGHACVVGGPAGKPVSPPAMHSDRPVELSSDASPVLSVRAPAAPSPEMPSAYPPKATPAQPATPPGQASPYTPPRSYTPPRHQPAQSYGPPQHPSQLYGPPQHPSQLFGSPEQPRLRHGAADHPAPPHDSHEPPTHQPYGPPERPGQAQSADRYPDPVYVPPQYRVPAHTSGPRPYPSSTAPSFEPDPMSTDSRRTLPDAAPEPAVLRGRDAVRRPPAGPREPMLTPRTPAPVPDAGDDEDPYSYREPYAPYRQDDVDDAEQQAQDMDLPRDDRFRIYADRDIVEDEEPAFVSIPGEARTRYDDLTDAGMAPPIFMDEDVQRRRTLVARLWAAGCLLGLVVLGLQCLYIYRTSIATAVPALRPALEAVCAPLGCQVGYARRLERISITASSLQPQSAAAPDDGVMRLTLRVTLRNRYDKPQPWPALMLQLTDLSDTVVVRKALLPENYLPPGTRGPFPAGGELSLSVPIQVDGLHVNGYQLDKFFP